MNRALEENAHLREYLTQWDIVIETEADNEKAVSLNRIDRELGSIEAEFDAPDRPYLMREVFADVVDRIDSSLHEDARIVQANGTRFKHYFLPGIPGDVGELSGIREGYDSRTEVYTSDSASFIRVGQGEMWVLPKKEQTISRVSLSECSCVVGVSQSDLYVAHISYSEMHEFEAVLAFMREQGVMPEHVYAVASVGELQEQKTQELGQHRVRREEYEERGVPASHIHEFQYTRHTADSDGTTLARNATHVLISKDFIFPYSFDLKLHYERRTGLREEQVSDYRDSEPFWIGET